MLWEVALFPYANITILFGSAMKNLKILHLTCDFLASNKNHAKVGEFYNKVTPIKNHAILQGCTPFLYTELPFPGNRVPIGIPEPITISNGLCSLSHCSLAHKVNPKMKSRPLQVPGFLGPM